MKRTGYRRLTKFGEKRIYGERDREIATKRRTNVGGDREIAAKRRKKCRER